jgi:hypothetical protein
MPCGMYADEAAEQARLNGERLRALGAERVVAVDAASSFSRPGPRLVDGVELLGHILHSDSVPAPEGIAWEETSPTAPAPFAARAADPNKWESTAPSNRSR